MNVFALADVCSEYCGIYLGEWVYVISLTLLSILFESLESIHIEHNAPFK